MPIPAFEAEMAARAGPSRSFRGKASTTSWKTQLPSTSAPERLDATAIDGISVGVAM